MIKNRQPRASLGGNLRLGKIDGNHPTKSSSFIFDPLDQKLLPEFESLFGKEPTHIPIRFASDDPEEAFDCKYRCYSRAGLLCSGDGEQATRNNGTPAWDSIPCPAPDSCQYALERKDRAGRPGCCVTGILQFLIPDLGALQVFRVSTRGQNSIDNLSSQIDLIRKATGGKLAGIDFVLSLTPKEVRHQGKPVGIYVLNLALTTPLRRIAVPCDVQEIQAPAIDDKQNEDFQGVVNIAEEVEKVAPPIAQAEVAAILEDARHRAVERAAESIEKAGAAPLTQAETRNQEATRTIAAAQRVREVYGEIEKVLLERGVENPRRAINESMRSAGATNFGNCSLGLILSIKDQLLNAHPAKPAETEPGEGIW